MSPKYEVKLADGSGAVVRASLDERGFEFGEEVEVSFAREDVKLLADGGRADVNMN